MTTNTISSTPSPTGISLNGALAIAAPPSGDPAVPVDFAVALAVLATAADPGLSRPKLADPGNAVPVADAAALFPVSTGPTDPSLLPGSGSAEEQPRPGGQDDVTEGDDDPVLDPALSWLIAPAPVAPDPVAVRVQCTATTLPQAEAPIPTVANQAPATAPGVELAQTSEQLVEATAAGPVAPTTSAAAATNQPEPARVPGSVMVERQSTEAPTEQPGARQIPRPTDSQAPRDPVLTKTIADALAVATAAAGGGRLVAAPPRFAASRIFPTIVAQPVTSVVMKPATGIDAALPALVATNIPPAKTSDGIAPPAREASQAPLAQLPSTAAAAAGAASHAGPAPIEMALPALAAIGTATRLPLPPATELRPLADSGANLFASALTSSAMTAAVQPAIDTQSPGMDLTRDSGLHRMIDRIEMLRDDADSRDTRIRLVPDALGPVEVSVRRDGDAVRVHFTADQPATRALIAEAQPRLNELAEARGVKISQASVDTGSAGDGRARHQPQQPSQPSASPRGARSETSDSSDERIA